MSDTRKVLMMLGTVAILAVGTMCAAAIDPSAVFPWWLIVGYSLLVGAVV